MTSLSKKVEAGLFEIQRMKAGYVTASKRKIELKRKKTQTLIIDFSKCLEPMYDEMEAFFISVEHQSEPFKNYVERLLSKYKLTLRKVEAQLSHEEEEEPFKEINQIQALQHFPIPYGHYHFFAEKGKGATLNGKPISVSVQDSVLKSCLVTGFPYTYLEMPNGPIQVFEKLIKQGIPVRRLGSAAIDLCWVAAGRFDGFYEHKLQAWDSAAGFLMVEEAGGRVTDFANENYSPYQPHILATNGKIHEELRSYII
ncbi:MAG: hypothetical protein EOO43_04365 [Flavobacterium sp.]|nr:MAG: hypothetical protein EOO43_04365 [Flavobacterium sp.]